MRRCSDKAQEGLFRFGLTPAAQTGSPSTDDHDDHDHDYDDNYDYDHDDDDDLMMV